MCSTPGTSTPSPSTMEDRECRIGSGINPEWINAWFGDEETVAGMLSPVKVKSETESLPVIGSHSV